MSRPIPALVRALPTTRHRCRHPDVPMAGVVLYLPLHRPSHRSSGVRMAYGRRPSICYIVPGLDLVPGSASTRQTLGSGALARRPRRRDRRVPAGDRPGGPRALRHRRARAERTGCLERPPGVAPLARAVHRGAMFGARHRARGHLADAGQADGVVRAARHPGRADRGAAVPRALARADRHGPVVARARCLGAIPAAGAGHDRGQRRSQSHHRPALACRCRPHHRDREPASIGLVSHRATRPMPGAAWGCNPSTASFWPAACSTAPATSHP